MKPANRRLKQCPAFSSTAIRGRDRQVQDFPLIRHLTPENETRNFPFFLADQRHRTRPIQRFAIALLRPSRRFRNLPQDRRPCRHIPRKKRSTPPFPPLQLCFTGHPSRSTSRTPP